VGEQDAEASSRAIAQAQAEDEQGKDRQGTDGKDEVMWSVAPPPYGGLISGKDEVMAKSMKLGAGGRFAALAAKTSPAIAAMAGQKKYGKKKMSAMAAKGKARNRSEKIGQAIMGKM
jgi:hypothetical protein